MKNHNNNRNATCLHTTDFSKAFMEWEQAKQKAKSDLITAASKLWLLGVSASLLVPLIKNACNDLEDLDKGGADDLEN